jgi:Cupin-like domain
MMAAAPLARGSEEEEEMGGEDEGSSASIAAAAASSATAAVAGCWAAAHGGARRRSGSGPPLLPLLHLGGVGGAALRCDDGNDGNDDHRARSRGEGQDQAPPFPKRRRCRRPRSSLSRGWLRPTLLLLLLGRCTFPAEGRLDPHATNGVPVRRIAAALHLCVGAAAFVVVASFVFSCYYVPWAITRPSRTSYDPVLRRLDIDPPAMDYRPGDAMDGYGDMSPKYAQIRQSIDRRLIVHHERTRARVQQLSQPRIEPRSSYLADVPEALSAEEHEQPRQQTLHIRRSTYSSYSNVRNCPATPPDGYPYEWNVLHILDHWKLDDIAHVPSKIYQSICVFDYVKDLPKIRAYRNAEVPFVVENDPAVLRTVERWNVPNYVDAVMGTSTRHGCEMSRSNHFLFYRLQSTTGHDVKDATSIPANRIMDVPNGMTYREWRDHADVMERMRGGNAAKDLPHYSLRLTAFGENPMKQLLLRQKKLQQGGLNKNSVFHEPLAEYLFDELPFFQPRVADQLPDGDRASSLYLVNATAQHGIYCRFGMAGTVADAHFDLGRNAIAVLRGHRRYIVSRPEQCHNFALFPRDHPSGRHSMVDWSNPRQDLEKYPEFRHAQGSELVVSAGQVLWLPSLYFHTIVSLDTTVQCNTRSGDPPSAAETFRECGF